MGEGRPGRQGEAPAGTVASVAAQLGTAFVLANLGALLAALAGSGRAASVAVSAVLAAVAFAAGLVAGREAQGVLVKVADLCWAFSVVYLAGAVFLIALPDAAFDALDGRNDRSFTLHVSTSADSTAYHAPARAYVLAAAVAAAYAVALYLLRRGVWMQTATVASAVALVVAALATRDGWPALAGGLLLTVLAAYLAVAAWGGWFRPVVSGYVLAATVAGLASWVLSADYRPVAVLVAAIAVAAAFGGAVSERLPQLVPVGALLVLVLGPRLLVAHLGVRHGIGVPLVLAAALLASAAAGLTARVIGPRPRVGGSMAAATATSLIGLAVLTWGAAPDTGEVVGIACTAVVCVAAVKTARWYAVVLTSLALLASLPSLAAAVGHGPVGGALLLVGGGALVVALAVRGERRTATGSTAAAAATAVAAGPSRTVEIGTAYPRVFAALQGAAEQQQFRVLLADEVAGRLLLADTTGPRCDLRLWGSDVQTSVAVTLLPPLAADTGARVDAVLYAAAAAPAVAG